ncbi:MAG: four helix bundle protein [Bacteroidales bacterium]|nr:four helix bundle protein [Bacteroidales bacterium]
MQYGSLQNLIVWTKSMQLAKKIYILVRSFPEEEKYGLCDQIRRAAVSIPSNIAEGYGRMSDKEFIRFLLIANGSLFEI